ncbi:DUF4126 domain-containing protein [Zhouia sp. PK063]|uniref:DUF4126 domain-containing protein n=1 Tax=Zhouia sp. PK063 TaxID=3373602 RepID=UPI0037B5C4CC
MTGTAILSVFLGMGLATATGFRVFLPLFVMSLGAYLGVISLNEQWIWLATFPALITFSTAMIIEVLAYYIPIVDNFLDSISLPLTVVVGTLVTVATFHGMNPVFIYAFGIIGGGGMAAAVKGTSAITRLVTTATTGGLANSLVSTLETLVSAVLAFVAIYIPLIAAFLVILVLFMVFLFYRKVRPRRK